MRDIILGKSRTNRHGLTKEQELVKENQGLKRENSRLRKLLARADLNRYENVKEAVEDHERNLGLPTTQDLLESLKKEWKCRECTEGYLEIIVYTKIGDPWYFRKCSDFGCKNRTKSQKYDSKSVRGIIKKSTEE